MKSESRPAKLDLYHHSKDSFTRTFNVTDSNGTAWDFTGYTLDCSIVPTFDSGNAIALTTSLTSGQAVISLSSAQVLTLGDEEEYKWYFKLTYPSGKIKTWFNGIYKQDFDNNNSEDDNDLTVSIGDQVINVTVSNDSGGYLATQYVDNETPSGTVNGVNTIFTLAYTPIAGKLKLYCGIRLTEGIDYTLVGNIITFTVAPEIGSIIRADYIKV